MPGDMVKIEQQTGDSYCMGDKPHYPYGTSICLRDEMIENLDAEQLQVGDVVEIRAFAVVESRRESAGSYEEKALDMQMTEISVRRKPADQDRAEKLYS